MVARHIIFERGTIREKGENCIFHLEKKGGRGGENDTGIMEEVFKLGTNNNGM